MTYYFLLFWGLWLSFGSIGSVEKSDPYVVLATDNKIIYDICFTPKGETIIVADGSKIKWYSTDSYELLSTFNKGHLDRILSVDISMDSTLLVSAGQDGIILVWDVLTQEIVHRLTYHVGIVTSVHFSTDNKFIISGGTDNQVYLYNLQTQQIVQSFNGHTDDITSIDVNPQGKTFATASADGVINLYDIDNHKLIKSLVDHKRWARAVAFNKEGSSIISCGDNSKIFRWDISDISDIKQFRKENAHESWLLSVDYLDDNNTYATGAVSGKIRISMRIGGYKTKINTAINRLVFMPNSGSYLKLAVATRGNGALLIDARDMKSINK